MLNVHFTTPYGDIVPEGELANGPPPQFAFTNVDKVREKAPIKISRMKRGPSKSRSKSDLDEYVDENSTEQHSDNSYVTSEAEAYDTSDDDSLKEPESDPAQQSPFETILSYRVNEDGSNGYFVKLRDRSYRDTTWVTAAEIQSFPHGIQTLTRYHKKVLFPPPPPYYNPIYDVPERIINGIEDGDAPQYFVKWTGLGYENCTWEASVPQETIDDYHKREIPRLIQPFTKPDPSTFIPLTEVKNEAAGLELFDYQIEGVNWLMTNWFAGRNCILADEMGLGKTIQAVAMLSHLSHVIGLPGPYLVIAPLATLPHWLRQFNTWTSLNVIVYHGNKKARQIIRDTEFTYSDGTGPKFDVVVTSYETVMKDSAIFTQFEWPVLIVDEAHRLKNTNSKLLHILTGMTTEFRILLSGTPLQNTIDELLTLLEFLHPGKFASLTNTTDSATDIIKLRETLQPHLLRRLKTQVDQRIAPKEETIIECSMTSIQKQYYKAILESNAGFLSHGANLNNIYIELRKVCIHPFLIKGAEEKILLDLGNPQTAAEYLLAIVRASGKMILLNKLLPKLKADGHRVLIFSQMTSFLDILQDYMAYAGYPSLRIDGSVKAELRQERIDQFNDPNSHIFVFMLSTRAGGLGINLNAADTVVIFDSDWNPQNDLQAQARCHRIGQEKTVKVYRLLTKGTYEEKMFDISSKKLGLGHAVLDKDRSKELDLLLRQGAYHMLNGVEEENYDEEDIDQILSRSKVMTYNEDVGSNVSKASFDVDVEGQDVDINDPDFWSKMLPKTAEEEDTDEGKDMYMRLRKRTQQQPSLIEPELDDEEHEWYRNEREKLQHLLSWFGWDRFDEAAQLVNLKRPTLNVKLAARAFLRRLLMIENDEVAYPIARGIFERSCTKEFDPSYEDDYSAMERDNDFMRQPAMIDPEFVQLMNKKGHAWIKRIELLQIIHNCIIKCDGNKENLRVPNVEANRPTEGWTPEDDRNLFWGTYKCGFARYEEMVHDPDITFTFGETLPPTPLLTGRLNKMLTPIRRGMNNEKPEEIEREIAARAARAGKKSTWRKRDRSVILQQMLHGGVTLLPNGEFDWDTFRESLGDGFEERSNEQIIKLVDELMTDKVSEDDKSEKPEEPEADGEKPEEPQSQPDKPEKKKKGEANITAARVRSRHLILTRLRKIMLKYTPEEFDQYFTYIPRWRNVPRGWTSQMEALFFREIAKRGWSVCPEILKMPEFETAFEGDPPPFLTADARVIHRLEGVLEYIEENSLQALKEKEPSHSTRKKKDPKSSNEVNYVPDVNYDADGKPRLPISLTGTSYVMEIGEIVYDRPAFHSERYLYPAGFKSTRLYTSVIDPSHRARYVCEILDTGDPTPLFRVTTEEDPSLVFEGPSPTTPWNLILKKIIEIKKPSTPRALSISGPEYYGLAHPTVIYILQNMPNADKCRNFQRREFQEQPPPTHRMLPRPVEELPDDKAQQQPPPQRQTQLPQPVLPEPASTPLVTDLFKAQQLHLIQALNHQQQQAAIQSGSPMMYARVQPQPFPQQAMYANVQPQQYAHPGFNPPMFVQTQIPYQQPPVPDQQPLPAVGQQPTQQE